MRHSFSADVPALPAFALPPLALRPPDATSLPAAPAVGAPLTPESPADAAPPDIAPADDEPPLLGCEPLSLLLPHALANTANTANTTEAVDTHHSTFRLNMYTIPRYEGESCSVID